MYALNFLKHHAGQIDHIQRKSSSQVPVPNLVQLQHKELDQMAIS